MSFSFSLFYLIRSQENHRAPDAKLNGEQNRHANLYDTALKVLKNACFNLKNIYQLAKERVLLQCAAQCLARFRFFLNSVFVTSSINN